MISTPGKDHCSCSSTKRVMLATDYLRHQLVMERFQASWFHPVHFSTFSMATLSVFIASPCDNIARGDHYRMFGTAGYTTDIPTKKQIHATRNIPCASPRSSNSTKLPFIIAAPSIYFTLCTRQEKINLASQGQSNAEICLFDVA